MITEKKDIIDRHQLYKRIIQRMNKKYGGATLNSSLALYEILEIFDEVPLEEDFQATWILDGSTWRCSWCKMPALESYGKSFPSKHCPYCGRRMKMEGNFENKA